MMPFMSNMNNMNPNLNNNFNKMRNYSNNHNTFPNSTIVQTQHGHNPNFRK